MMQEPSQGDAKAVLFATAPDAALMVSAGAQGPPVLLGNWGSFHVGGQGGWSMAT